MSKQKNVTKLLQLLESELSGKERRSGPSPGKREEDQKPLLVTNREACRRLRCSRSTLYRMVRAGRLERVELLPGCGRIRLADLERLAKGRKQAEEQTCESTKKEV